MTQQPLISDQDKTQLKRIFRKDLNRDVYLRLFTQRPSPVTIPGRECRYCAQTQQLMEELTALSPKVHLETIDYYKESQLAKEHGVTRIPAIEFGGDEPSGEDPTRPGPSRLKFYGIPSGHQLATVVEDIKTISRGVSPLTTGTRKKLRQMNKPVHIQVFVTPTDTFCPGQARLAHAFALESPKITADVVEMQEFPLLAQNYNIRSVPLTVINEFIRLEGVAGETQLLEKVLEAGVIQAAVTGGSQ